jgi:hypothetical protein
MSARTTFSLKKNSVVCGSNFESSSFTSYPKLTKFSSSTLLTHPFLITYLFTMALDAYNAAVTAYNTLTPCPVLPNPNTTNVTVQLRENVWRLLEGDEPENTRKAMEPKMYGKAPWTNSTGNLSTCTKVDRRYDSRKECNVWAAVEVPKEPGSE